MSENKQTEALPSVEVRRSSLWQRLPIVWLVPLVAVLAGGWLAVKAVREKGPTIEISFLSAEGLEAGKTKVKYKELDIGLVKSVELSPDRSHVIVKAEMSRSVADLMVEDTRFWVVRPRVANGGISGLETLLSGAYIGMDVGKKTSLGEAFKGLEVPPILTSHRPGRLFRLKAKDLGSIGYGTPVYFRRIEVGELVAYELDKDGGGITAKVFIHAPYDHYVTNDTRFWHASGVDLSVDSAGVKLKTESLSTILQGGIAFGEPKGALDGSPAEAEASFMLADSRDAAFRDDDSEFDEYEFVFNESVRGLQPGATVDFRGVVVGEVVGVGMSYDTQKKRLSVPVRVHIFPRRIRALLHSGTRSDPAARQRLLKGLVDEGLRAQLRTGNLLTGQLYVALDFFPQNSAQKADWSHVPPVLPTTQGDLQELQTKLASIVTKLDKIPFEEIAADLRKSMQSLDKALKDADALLRRFDGEVTPELKATLAEARQTFTTANQTLSQQSPMQQELQRSLREVTRAAQSVRELTDYLEQHPEALIKGKTEEKKP